MQTINIKNRESNISTIYFYYINMLTVLFAHRIAREFDTEFAEYFSVYLG